ncbi:hypothetical protein DL93DRAFT_2082822 [Clavulina sp. PMI_390]|nr:hypothetical protein DL93DRAFT_2082822 [Clavulina sp. PMI_390]
MASGLLPVAWRFLRPTITMSDHAERVTAPLVCVISVGTYGLSIFRSYHHFAFAGRYLMDPRTASSHQSRRRCTEGSEVEAGVNYYAVSLKDRPAYSGELSHVNKKCGICCL